MTSAPPIDPTALLAYLDDEAPARLTTYFDSGTFTGGRFERFAGGGDRPEVADVFDADDIVAVSLLGVRVPGRPALEILGSRRSEITPMLAEIPLGMDLWDAPAKMVAPGSAADQLWHLLDGLPGIGWVTAGKLLARKRPRLIPVYDNVVKAAFNRPDFDDWWGPLRTALIEDSRILQQLEEMRDQLGLSDISLLRILDVAIWMREYGQPEPTPDSDS